ncbi:MAG TPA: FkbM family methyltransferase [Sphingobium sp.]
MPSEASIKQVLASGRYALVGAGQLGAMSLAQWPVDVARPEFILDSVRTAELDGIEVRSLADHVPQAGVTYLLSAFKMPPSAIRAIFDHLGQAEILTVYDFFEEFTPAIFSNGWRNIAPTADALDRLAAMPGCYDDDLSRQICRAVTAWRYRRELIDDFPVAPEEDKYDLSLFGRGGVHYDLIYDGGAFDLGLFTHLAEAGISWGKGVAFEPDPVNMERCTPQKRRWESERGAPIQLDRRALSDSTKKSRFLANGLFSSRLVEDSTLSHAELIDVETCRLDDVHRQLFGDDAAAPKRILLKLHVEGSELAALHGARKLLSRHHVDILVNLAHDEASYRDIPAYLAGFGRFDQYLRCHALFGEGLTLFARNKLN